jgi:radical SAM superfamily enzyme YgiQ (UPF0313 family)
VREVQLTYARPAGRIGRITLSVNSFVPKPFTPFQWEPMEHVDRLNKKQRYLEKVVRNIGNMNIIHDLPKWEYIQALLSRGDRRIGSLIKTAHEKNGDWKAAARELKTSTDFYVTRRRAFSEPCHGILLTSVCGKIILGKNTRERLKASSRRCARLVRA